MSEARRGAAPDYVGNAVLLKIRYAAAHAALRSSDETAAERVMRDTAAALMQELRTQRQARGCAGKRYTLLRHAAMPPQRGNAHMPRERAMRASACAQMRAAPLRAAALRHRAFALMRGANHAQQPLRYACSAAYANASELLCRRPAFFVRQHHLS
jgi:hypothetical protein